MKPSSTLIASWIAIMFFSCQKEKVNVSSPSLCNNPVGATTPINGREKEHLCQCTGFVLKQDGNDFSCPSGSGCTKIQKCPCIFAIVAPGQGDNLFIETAYDLYKDALTGGTLTNYFSTHKWKHIFLDLINHPDVLEGLQSGALTMVERTNSAGSLMELVIPSSLWNKFFCYRCKILS